MNSQSQTWGPETPGKINETFGPGEKTNKHKPLVRVKKLTPTFGPGEKISTNLWSG